MTPARGTSSTRIAPGPLAAKLRRLRANEVAPSTSTVEDILECLDALAWYDDHCREPGLHADAELDRPEHLSSARLVEIVAECLRRWDAFPTIPGSRRWARNGGVALAELERRLRDIA